LPQIDEAVFLLKGDRTDGAECSYAAPAPFKFRCVCPEITSFIQDLKCYSIIVSLKFVSKKCITHL
ncbi:MAG: hypothetical protein MJK14_24540, partial [Rivularia sp. ALOHA_DT_140]|nr:hypothetical protein [Rivularia sp. ALOHA_DT_140]